MTPAAALPLLRNARAGAAGDRYELCYRPLADIGRGYAFPCDAHGQVEVQALSERALNNYLYARAVVGREFGWPRVERRA